MPGLHTRGEEFANKILKGIESKLYIKINDELKYFGEIETLYNEKTSTKLKNIRKKNTLYSPDNEIKFKIDISSIISILLEFLNLNVEINPNLDLIIDISLAAELELNGITQTYSEKDKNKVDLRQYELRDDNFTMINIPFIVINPKKEEIISNKHRIVIKKRISLNAVSTEKFREYC